MDVTYVVTVFGTDRPGIIDRISNITAKHQASWQESQLTQLAGRFAGIITISIPESHASTMEDALSALNSEGLELRFEPTSPRDESEACFPLHFDLVGHDRPGILGELSSALSSAGVNIVALQTECTSAPMSGEMLFHAHAELLCPRDLAADRLRETLERIGQDLMVDIVLDESPRD